jgi:hypothetical protein
VCDDRGCEFCPNADCDTCKCKKQPSPERIGGTEARYAADEIARVNALFRGLKDG